MLEIYDKKRITDTIIQYSTNNWRPVYPEYAPIFDKARNGDIDVDGFIEAYELNTLVPVSHKKFVSSLIVYRNLFEEYGHANYVVLINWLIGNQRAFDKIRFCVDGSYRENRIWFDCWDNEICIDVREGFSNKTKSLVDMSPKELKRHLKKLFNSYPIVFCQFATGSESEIHNYVRWKNDRSKYAYDGFEDYV